MDINYIVEILRKSRVPLTFKEIEEIYFMNYDRKEYSDPGSALRTAINRNIQERALNLTNSSIFYSVYPKNTFGQKIGLSEWLLESKTKYLELDASNDIIDSSKIEREISFFRRNETNVHTRDIELKLLALASADYSCEYDSNHYCFKRKTAPYGYTEAHHIIPLAAQELVEFKNVNLDCIENIISLCSNCHNQLHYGDGFEKILYAIYIQRKDKLKSVGIDITFDELLEFYR